VGDAVYTTKSVVIQQGLPISLACAALQAYPTEPQGQSSAWGAESIARWNVEYNGGLWRVWVRQTQTTVRVEGSHITHAERNKNPAAPLPMREVAP